MHKALSNRGVGGCSWLKFHKGGSATLTSHDFYIHTTGSRSRNFGNLANKRVSFDTQYNFSTILETAHKYVHVKATNTEVLIVILHFLNICE